MPIELPPNNDPNADLFSQADLEAASAKSKEDIPRIKLFLSFEGLLMDIASPIKKDKNLISPEDPNSIIDVKTNREIIGIADEDLEKSIFYLDITRDEFIQANNDIANKSWDEIKKIKTGIISRVTFFKHGLAAYIKIKEAIESAEKENRIIWPENDQRTYEKLNSIFKKNGLPIIPGESGSFSIDEITAYLKMLKIPLEVVD